MDFLEIDANRGTESERSPRNAKQWLVELHCLRRRHRRPLQARCEPINDEDDATTDEEEKTQPVWQKCVLCELVFVKVYR